MFWAPISTCPGGSPVFLLYVVKHLSGKLQIRRTVGTRHGPRFYPDDDACKLSTPILWQFYREGQRMPDIPHLLAVRWHMKHPSGYEPPGARNRID